MPNLTKVHVECGVVVGTGKATDLFLGLWSETIDVGQATTKTAGATADAPATETGTLIFRVRAPTAAEIYVAEGKTPDASVAVSTSDNNNRAHLAAGELRDIPTRTGAKLATVAV